LGITVVTEKIYCPHHPKEDHDDRKPAADIRKEYSYDYLYSPNVGAVTKK